MTSKRFESFCDVVWGIPGFRLPYRWDIFFWNECFFAFDWSVGEIYFCIKVFAGAVKGNCMSLVNEGGSGAEFKANGDDCVKVFVELGSW